MALTLRLSTRSTADLADIRDYLVPLSPRGAENVRLALEATLDLLCDFPGMGHVTDIPDIRMMPVRRYGYLIYYTMTSNRLVIVHIRHGARSPATPDDMR